jgi:hypothetical protein
LIFRTKRGDTLPAWPDDAAYVALAEALKAAVRNLSIDNLARRRTDQATQTWRGTYQGIRSRQLKSNAL